MTPPSLVRRQAIRAAATTWRQGCDAMDRMTVEAAARACHAPGGPSIDDLEQAIRDDRAARLLAHRTAA